MKKRIIFCLILSLFISVHYTHAAIIGETSDGRPISNTGGYGCGPFSGPEAQEFREENPGYTANELYVCDPKPETEWKWPDQVPKPHSTAPTITPTPVVKAATTITSKTTTPLPYVCDGSVQDILHDECDDTFSVTAQDVYNMETDTEARVANLEARTQLNHDAIVLDVLGSLAVLAIIIFYRRNRY